MEIYQHIFELNPDALLVVDNAGRIARSNPQAARMFGFECDALVDQPVEMLLPHGFGVSQVGHGSEYLKGPDSRSMGVGPELFGRRKDGSEFPVDVILGPLESEEGKFLLCVVRDITADQRATALRDISSHLEQSERRYEQLLGVLLERSHIPMLVVTAETNHRILSANQEYTKLFGYSLAETPDVESWWLRAYPDPEYRAGIQKAWAEAIAKAEREGLSAIEPVEARATCLDGSTRDVKVHMSTFGGRSLVLFDDLTERLKLEADLRQARKMEALGQLSGRVAHDFNNLLTVINGYSDILFRKLEGQPDLQRRADQIRKAGISAKGITDQLLAFSQKRLADPVLLNFNTLLNGSRDILEQLVGPRVALQFDLAADLHPVLATVVGFQQVLINLATNARDAMPDGGQLLIRTRNEWIEKSSAPRPYVVLTARDSGEGIPAEHIEKLFDPFFTTKLEGKGTGLGLATVYGIVKQRGGWVDVESKKGAGATFSLYFPAAMDPLPEPDPGVEQKASQERLLPLTILLVDDDDAVRDLCSYILRSRGCAVLTAAGGMEGLKVSREYSGKIDLLVSDVVMPGLAGPPMTERLRVERPGLPVLFMTGYAAEAIKTGPGVSVIAKPFDEQQFLDAVAALSAAINGEVSTPAES